MIETSAQGSQPGSGRQVLGLFHDREHLEAAAYKLQSVGFNRANLSMALDLDLDGVPDPGPREDVTTSTDVRKLRTLGTSLASAVAALAAGGITIASGGAAALAFGAAALAGGGAAAGARALGPSTQNEPNEGHVILVAYASQTELERKAIEALKEAGADKVWTDPPAA